MPVYRNIDDLTAGDSYTLIRDLDPLDSGAIITNAWFTVKERLEDNDAMAKINLSITVNASASGFINNYLDGSGSRLTFTITPPMAAVLSPSETYFYDICALSATAQAFTVEIGKLYTTQYVRHLLA
jgi:hypothetical protein